MAAVFVDPLLLDAPVLHREVCNHRRYSTLGRTFYFSIDPRIMKRGLLTDATYMTDHNFDVWLALYFLQKIELHDKKKIPCNLIKVVALYL